MLFQGLIHPTFSLHFELFADAFSPHHLPMALFFGGDFRIFFWLYDRFFLVRPPKRKKTGQVT
jgi:hypothetical protein